MRPNAILQTVLALFTRAVVALRKQGKQTKGALAAIALFLAVAFTFVVKGDQRQALGTALAQAEQADTAAAHVEAAEANAAAEVEVVKTPAGEVEVPKSYAVGEKLEKMEPLAPQTIDSETLWLARGIYSETKEPQEQELVAWTVRNRVETEYRGNSSYEEAVLDPYQYSAFIEGTSTRKHYGSLQADSKEPGFQTAVAIAQQVKNAPATVRPFKQTTRHFYSEQSMVGGRAPKWAVGQTPTTPARPIELDAKRFRFYADVR